MIKMVLAGDLAYAMGNSTRKTGLPWKSIREDFQHFQSETKPLVYVVVGTNTFNILANLTSGKLLEDRKLVVLSRTLRHSPHPDVLLCNSIEEVRTLLKGSDYAVCGGKQIYEAYVPYADEIVFTRVHAIHEGADCYINPSLFDGFTENTSRSKILREKSNELSLVTAHYYERT